MNEAIGITQRCTARHHYALDNEQGQTVGTVEQRLEFGLLRSITTNVGRYTCSKRSPISVHSYELLNSPYQVSLESTGKIVAGWKEKSSSVTLANGELLRFGLQGGRPASAVFELVDPRDTMVLRMNWVAPIRRWSFVRPFPLGRALLSGRAQPMDDMVFLTALAFHLFACACSLGGRA